MKLRSVKIVAAPNSNPEDARVYSWREGMPLDQLDIAIAKLSEVVAEMRAAESDPTRAQKPITIE